jgi:hypothetical protein
MMCVRRDGQVRIEPDERHLEHSVDPNRPGTGPACGAGSPRRLR